MNKIIEKLCQEGIKAERKGKPNNAKERINIIQNSKF